MSLRGFLVGLVLCGFLEAPVRAQFVPSAPVVLVPNGIGFSYRSGPLRVNGFFSNGYSVGTLVPGYSSVVYGPVPYYLPLNGYVDYRVNYNFISPRVVLVPGPFPPLTSNYDLSGVDLDVVPARKAFGLPGQGEVRVAGKPNPPPAKLEPKNVAARARPPEVAKVAKPAPEPEPARQRDLPRNELPPPRNVPVEEGQRLLELGLNAFRDGNFGVAAQRFRQATEADPNTARAFFHLAQAHFALGKYRDAVAAIERGLERQPDWPRSAFRPRVDLYRGLEDDWGAHRLRLEETVRLHPKDATSLLLLAHQLWFDGERVESVAMFRRAHELKNSLVSDAFLKAAEPVAQK